MRTLIFLFLAVCTSTVALAQKSWGELGGMTYSMYPKLKDGWYSASVQYSNPNTGTNSTYTLNVEVNDDRVVRIEFGEGRGVHTGYNNSDYQYTGGYLRVTKDYQGNITGAQTTVTIWKGGYQYNYEVEIE